MCQFSPDDFNGIFRLCEAEDRLLSPVGEELCGYLPLFVQGRTQSQQNGSIEVSETVPGNWDYLAQTR